MKRQSSLDGFLRKCKKLGDNDTELQSENISNFKQAERDKGNYDYHLEQSQVQGGDGLLHPS